MAVDESARPEIIGIKAVGRAAAIMRDHLDRMRGSLPPMLRTTASDWDYFSHTLTLEGALRLLDQRTRLAKFAQRQLSEAMGRPGLELQQGLSALRSQLGRVVGEDPNTQPVVILGCCPGTPSGPERGIITGTVTRRSGKATTLSLSKAALEAKSVDAVTRRVRTVMPNPNALEVWAAQGLEIRGLVQPLIREHPDESVSKAEYWAVVTGQGYQDNFWTYPHEDAGCIHRFFDPATGKHGFGSHSPCLIATIVWPLAFAGYVQVLVPIHEKTGHVIAVLSELAASFEQDLGFKPWIGGPVKHARHLLRSRPHDAPSVEVEPYSVVCDEGRDRLLRGDEAERAIEGLESVDGPPRASESHSSRSSLLAPDSRASISCRPRDNGSGNNNIDTALTSVVSEPMDSRLRPPFNTHAGDGVGVAPDSESGVNGDREVPVLLEMQRLRDELLETQGPLLARFVELLREHGGEELPTSGDTEDYARLVNELLTRFGRKLVVNGKEKARLGTRPGRRGQTYLRYDLCRTGSRTGSVPAQTIPINIHLTA